MQQFYYLSFVGILLLSACRKENFSSESNWVAPLLETSLTLGDLLPDSITSQSPNGELDVVFESRYGVSNLDDILNIPDRVENIEVTLESLILDDRSFTDTLTLLELYPPSAFLNGQTTELPAQNITANEGTVLDVTEQFFTTATFIEGFIDISISNDLPVEAEVLEFELRNDDDKSIIVSGQITDLAPNTTAVETYSLADKTVDGVMELVVKRVQTKASNGDVLVEVEKGIRTTISVSGLKPKIATAVFPAQNLVDQTNENEYDFGGAELVEVHIKSGSMLVKVESTIEESIIIEHRIPNSYKSGQPGSIEQYFTIPPAPKGETVMYEERFPIDDFVILLYGESRDVAPIHNRIFSELIARIDYSGVERTLSLDDKVKIEFGLVDLKPFLVIGDPGEHQLMVQDTVDIKVLENLDGRISLDEATMELDFYNSFGIETQINSVKLTGKNNRENTSVTLTPQSSLSNLLLERATNPPLTPFRKGVILDKNNSNVKLFLQNLPDQIAANIDATVRPNGTPYRTDFAFGESELAVDMKLSVPLIVGFANFGFSTNADLDLEDIAQAQNIREVTLKAEITNDFPVSGKLALVFKDKDGDFLFAQSSTDNMAAAQASSTSSHTDTPAQSTLELPLSRAETELLKQAKEVEITATFDTEDAKRYQMFSDYTIDLKLITDFIYENNL